MTSAQPVKWLKKQGQIIRLLLILLRHKEGREMLKQVSKGEIPETFAIAWAENWVRENKAILDRFD